MNSLHGPHYIKKIRIFKFQFTSICELREFQITRLLVRHF